MTTQLALFDATLPARPCTYEQVAVVFTSMGGRDKGQQVYHVHPEPAWYRDYLAKRQRAAGITPDARVARRTVTCGEWETM